MFQNLPIELQCHIFRNYFSFAEKMNVFHVKEFEKILLARFSWRERPKIALSTYMHISKNYLHILKPGHYVSHSLKSLYEIVLHAKTGELTLESFTLKNYDGSTRRRSASTNYSIPEFQNLLMNIRHSSEKISEYCYVNRKYYVCIDRPELFTDDIIYRTGPDQLSCLQKKHLYIMDVHKNCPSYELEFRMREFIRKRGLTFEKHDSYKIMKLTHWRMCLKSTLKVRYTYRPRKNVVEAKSVRKLLYE